MLDEAERAFLDAYLFDHPDFDISDPDDRLALKEAFARSGVCRQIVLEQLQAEDDDG